MNNNQSIFAERIYSLDFLRGFAALAVVFWHWQHFFYSAEPAQEIVTDQQPLFPVFKLFYMHGSLAVELFFCISGFVFFWLFSSDIRTNKISAYNFAVSRFSRLYPLHIVTLAAVAALQYAYISKHANFFIYQANDFYHAILNVLLIPAWGFEKSWSFNAPIWSVSIEVMLYGIFFIICKLKRFQTLAILLLIITGCFIYPDNSKIGSGLLTFFCGGGAYLLLSRIVDGKGARFATVSSCVVAGILWLIVLVEGQLSAYFMMGLVFPVTVMSIASINLVKSGFMKPVAKVGDLSYSSYLIHFPLQIVFAMTADALGYSRSIFYNPWVLLLFMCFLISLSLLCHNLLEMPAQRRIREKLTRSRIRPPLTIT